MVGMLPAGTALCLGGGHEWHEMIAPRCELGGPHCASRRSGGPVRGERDVADHDDHACAATKLHADVPTAPTEHLAHASHPLDSDCGGCRHHERHQDSPCTDVPSSDHVARVQLGERLAMPEATLQPPSPPVLPSCALIAVIAPSGPAGASKGLPDRGGPPLVIAQSLRAVILLV